MTKTHWHKEELITEFGQQAVLRDIIKSLEDNAAQSGCVIISVKMNDKVLSETEESEFAENPVTNIESLSITIEEPMQVLKNILKSWTDLLPVLQGKIDTVSEVVRFQHGPERYKMMTDVIDTSLYFVTSLQDIKAFVLSKEYDLSQWTQAEAMLSKTTEELMDAFKKENFTLVADIMEYDLNNCIQEWHTLIKNLRTQIT